MVIKDNDEECIANSTLVSLAKNDFQQDIGHSFGPGSEKKWYSTYDRQTTKENGQSR